MPRIFKGIESELRLLLHPCILTGEITDIKVALFTNDPSVAIEFTDRYTIDDNILTLTVPTWAFGTMEEGVINYVIQGMHNDDAFITDRQSNYYLKTPTDYIPEEMPEEVVLGELSVMLDRNGIFKYFPEDVDAWKRARIEVNVPDTNGSFDEGYDKGKNDGYDSGYQDGYNAGQPIKYNTIADIYGSTAESTVKFKGLVALSFAYGNGYYILFTDHTGSILLRNHKDFLKVGDECVVTATLRRSVTSYISVLFTASVEVLSSNNYVVMPADAVELTNVDELYIPNENGYAEMKYLYVDGKVIGSPREDFMRLETDASSQGNIGLRGDFKDWVEKLKEGDSIRVYMFTENSKNNFDVKDIVQLGTEGGSCNLIKEEFTLKGDYEQFTASDYGADGFESVTINAYDYGKQKFNEGVEEGKNQGGECNLEDKWVTPSMGDRDDNGLIVVNPSEGYDGMSRTVIDPSTIYNEGVSAGKAEGGDLTIGTGDIYLSVNERGQRFEILPSEFDYDAFDKFIVELENFDLGGDANIYEASMVNDLLMGGKISYGNVYLFKGQITEIQRIRPEYGDARYTLDGSLNVYNGQTMGYDIQVGDNVIVIGTLSEYNGVPQFSAGSMIKVWWREGGDCPELTSIDITENGTYEGAFNVVNVNVPQEGGSCNLGILEWTLTSQYGAQKNASEDGYDGYNMVVVRPEPIIAQQREEAINDFKNKLKEITITENGRYSVDDTELRNYIEFDGNSYFDTNIPFGENTKIEVAITKTTYEEDEQVIGVAHYDLLVAETYGGFGIVAGAGLTYGVFGNAKTDNIGFSYEEEQILTLDRNGLNSSLTGRGSWFDESGLDRSAIYGQTIGIGKIKSVSDGWAGGGLNGRIRYVKIWTDGNDDSTMTLFRPKNMAQGGFGMVNSEGTEYNYVENLGEGTATFISEWVRKYGEGWKEINVNIPTIQDSAKDYYYCPLILGDTGFGEAAKSWDAGMVTLNNYDGGIIEDKLYVPTSSNKNEFRTKEKARFVQRLPNDVSILGSMEFGAGVEHFVTSEGKQFTNLTDLTIGPDMNYADFGPSTFPTLKRIWCFSETDNIDVYFSMGSYFYDSGTLYLKNHSQETEWKTSLPSGWTIVLL